MKKKLTFALIVVALLAAVAFTGCMGQDGKVYVTVSCSSSYGGAAALDSGAGLPNSWSFNTKYEINPGTWTGYYDLAYLSSITATYNYAVNSYGVFGFGSEVGSAYAAYYTMVTLGYSYSGTFSFEAEKGKFLSDGADRNYLIYLAWYASDTTISYNGVPLAKTILADTADKTVMQFSSGYDKITLSFDKKAAVKANLNGMSLSKIEGPAPAAVKAKKK